MMKFHVENFFDRLLKLLILFQTWKYVPYIIKLMLFVLLFLLLYFQAFIHVSTAYSNADKDDILETVYPVPTNILSEIKSNKILSTDLLKNIGRKMQLKHPNTYTVTKALAEWIVAEYSDEIPSAIVRPSIGK